uniref:Tubulin-specific chaperone A n=1 Tax=Magallana gigas TaxID=29159 RepID=A0A8W8I9Z6_MAGGI
MADPRVKQIKIKTGVVKRLTKEKVSYEKEAVKIEEKVEQMKADKKDEYEIKKMIEVLQESKMMIPDTLKRLNNAYADLDTLLTKEEDLSETEEYKAGKTALEEAKARRKKEQYSTENINLHRESCRSLSRPSLARPLHLK